MPTPVDQANRPDLGAVMAATRMLAGLIDPERRPTIVYESTVYPGVTEDMCGPEIERVARARSAAAISGSDTARSGSIPATASTRIDRITKVIAGEDAEVVEQLAAIYGAVTSGGVFRAASIKAAEAAKAIENAQRDINIAFINEVTQIFSRIGVSVWDVLDAARTKWNFLGFEPGLVGGHCIGVDPYYLSHLAQQVGHDPQVILAGRQTNDGMGAWIADALHDRRRKAGSALVLGLTFKENVPDLRNSRSFDLVRRLKWLGHEVEVADPIASPDGDRARARAQGDRARRPALRPGRRRGRPPRLSRACPTSSWPRWSRPAGRSPTSRACGAAARSIPASTGGRCELRRR